ncbi:MAG TPA: transketolase, partial [Iamia sp.]|nr:transketolase [Iamia sp.]
MTDADLEQRAINVIRGLAMDMPIQANSGHQGTAMALAPLAHVLWTRVMTYDAGSPHWVDRDRFVLSAGHASVLQYAMLHLTGVSLTIDDLKDFRQWGSATPGHPEAGHTVGVEVTTGPLGQGLGQAVGLALAERWLRATYGQDVVDHHTWVIASDGDMQEGISHEAASLAGHLGLGRLIAVYDDNHISIDGRTDLTFSDDTPGRFRAYGWEVVELGEASEDLDALEAALVAAKTDEDRPTLVVVQSKVGYPSPKWTDDPKAHGNPIDAEEAARTKEVMGLPSDETFSIPDDVLELYREAGLRGQAAHGAWQTRFDLWDGDKSAWAAGQGMTGVPGWEDDIPSWAPGDSPATRVASGEVFQALCEKVPGLIGGGADLSGNTGTALKGLGVQSLDDPAGRQIYFGIREHGMAAAMNGMALHGGVIPYGGTFMVFSDYSRPSIRLAALMGIR